MYRMMILNKSEIDDYNKKHNTNYKSIHIKQERNKYYIILDCDEIIELGRKEALKYFI